mmetsp:Transcript_136725/g.265945  ORF Transcript_136725/g.265945 Transcript_136725/m.265945 type:complete len:139 (+) Transcript_136725:108-524(+)
MSPDVFSRSVSEGAAAFPRCHASCWPGLFASPSLHGLVSTEFIESSSFHSSFHSAQYREWTEVRTPKLPRPARGDSPLSCCAGVSPTQVDVQPDLLAEQNGHDNVIAGSGTPRNSCSSEEQQQQQRQQQQQQQVLHKQ